MALKKSYFFDSYAVVSLIKGNSNYAKYVQEPVVLTIFNLAEIYWASLKEYGAGIANQVYDEYKPAVAEIDDETLKESIRFRLKNKNKNLSYADCIGYVFALRNGMIFLTGDKEFEELKEVEFVK